METTKISRNGVTLNDQDDQEISEITLDNHQISSDRAAMELISHFLLNDRPIR